VKTHEFLNVQRKMSWSSHCGNGRDLDLSSTAEDHDGSNTQASLGTGISLRGFDLSESDTCAWADTG
jgi:hypothetical protein